MKEVMFVLMVVFFVSVVEDVIEYATTDRTPMTIHNIPEGNVHLVPSILNVPTVNLPDTNQRG